MIYDTLQNPGRYPCIPHTEEISGFFAAHEIALLADGSHPIAGDDVVLKEPVLPKGDCEHPVRVALQVLRTCMV